MTTTPKRRTPRLPRAMMQVAKLEIAAWTRKGSMPRGLVMIILFAFIHRFTTGQTVEESFFPPEPAPPGSDYQI